MKLTIGKSATGPVQSARPTPIRYGFSGGFTVGIGSSGVTSSGAKIIIQTGHSDVSIRLRMEKLQLGFKI